MKIGDIVWIVDVNRREPRKGSVTRVGRKFFYVGLDRFSLTTMIPEDDYNHCRAYTEGAWEVESARRHACRELAAFGIQLDYRLTTVPAVEVYEALKALIEEKKARQT